MFFFVTGRELAERPRFARIAHDMFVDRAVQFRDRLGWDVTVDPVTARETDQYDLDDTVYAIIVGEADGHAGSMRLRPTTTPVMINDYFTHILPQARPFHSDRIWESTRFCISPDCAEARLTAARLMYGTAIYARAHGIDAIVAVFDERMIPIYKRIGWPPKVLGDDGGLGHDRCSAGIWTFDATLLRVAAVSAKLSPDQELTLRQAVAGGDLVA